MDSFEVVLPKLLNIPLFSDFSKGTEDDLRIMKMVYDNISIKKYKKGDIIIKEGEIGELCFILYKGSVHIYRQTPAGDTFALANLSSEQNFFFGETALISDDPRSATVQALTDCTTIALSGKKFLSMCQKEPVLGFKVVLYIARNMAKTITKANNDKATLYEALYNEIEGNYE